MAPRVPLVASAIAVAVVSAAAFQEPTLFTFDHLSAATLPAGFTTASFRQPEPGRWAISRLDAGGALHHAAVPGVMGWSLALAPAAPAAAFRVTARVRLSGGNRAGGLVWHYQDARNFMAAVLDLGDGDLELFRVSDGNRIRLEDRDGLELDALAWHTLRVIAGGGKTTVSIGGIRVLDWDERRSGARMGRVGVLAHGRADAAFDDLRVEPLSGRQGR
jgi:hypothetical protein